MNDFKPISSPKRNIASLEDAGSSGPRRGRGSEDNSVLAESLSSAAAMTNHSTDNGLAKTTHRQDAQDSTKMQPVEPLISVIVCTFNRSRLLARLLSTLSDQSLPATRYELVVVNNNSTDDTQETATELLREFSHARVVFEGQQGLSYARNRGTNDARGAYVAFIDDDCRAPTDWLSVAESIIAEHSPVCFGGPILPYFDVPRPCWFKDEYATHFPYTGPKILPDGEYTKLFGGNLFIRRELVDRVGGFRCDLGMSGDKIAFGEETALLRAIEALKVGGMYYDPRLHVYHLVRPEKFSLRYQTLKAIGAGRSNVRQRAFASEALSGKDAVWTGARAMLYGSLDVLRGLFFRDRVRYPYFANYLFEHTGGYLRRLGESYETWLRRGR